MFAPSPVMDSIHCVVLSSFGLNVAGSEVFPAASAAERWVSKRGAAARGGGGADRGP